MKKLLLFVICALALSVNAQTIDVIREGQTFSMISPSAKYIAGNIDDIAVYYNVETTEAAVLEGEIQDDGGCFVWDLNDKGELAVEHLKKAAIWTEDGGFDYLPEPEGLKKSEQRYSAARAITNDGKTVVVSFGDPTISVYVYTLSSDGIWDMVKLPMPKEDPIFHQPAQFAAPMGINDAATRIMGRYRIDTGLEELPFAWEKNANGEWEIRWVALDFIVEGGETDAVYPGDFEFNGAGLDVSEWLEEYDKAYAEYEQMWVDYETIIKALATGYYYNGVGSLSGMRLSPNGKYANVQISHEQTNTTYPAVIDLDANTVHVFTCLSDAACLSVTNDGVISMATPKGEYFSYAHISSIADPTKSQTLTEWTKEKTNGKINLADYMTYETSEGTKVAEGSATLASNGVGYVTWQYNGFGDNQRYETYVVDFGAQAPIDTTNQASLQYCTDDIVSACGMDLSQEIVAQSVAIKLTQKQLLIYQDNYVIKMAVGLAADKDWTPESVASFKFWIRRTLEGENLWEQDYDVSKVVFGAWNELVFDNFYAIDGASDLYFGYTIECGGLPIGGDGNNNSANPNATWIFDGTQWIQYSNCGNFSIKVIISGENMPEYNLAMNVVRTANFARTDSKFDAVANISNTIDKDVNSFDFVVYANSTEVYRKTETLAEALKNGEALNIFFKDIQFTEEGEYDVVYTIENINGTENDDNADDSKQVVKTLVSNEFEDKVVMLEMFSGTMCSTCPTGHNYLHHAIDELGIEKYVWAIHHVGYNASELTLDESSDALAFYGASMTYAPGVMLDRVNLLNVGVTSSNSATGPVFSVNEVGSRGVLEDYMEVIQKNMSPIKLEVQHTIDTITRELVVNIRGELLGNFDINKVRLGVITLEDSIAGTQAGVAGKYYHNHIIRSFMTSTYGDIVSITNGEFSIEFRETLKNKFELNNMSIAVWVGKDADISDINGFEIYQAYQQDLVLKTDYPGEEEPIEPEIYTLTTGAEDTNMGIVEVTLTAKSVEGFEFDSWSDGSTENPRTIILTENTELYARFRIKDISVNIDTSKISSVNVYANNGILYVDGVETDYHVLDAAGRLIYTGRNAQLSLPCGVYVIAVDGEVQKVVL